MNLARLQIMGILNLTPDSFSDGGKFNNTEKALKQAKKLQKEGANIIDIGGQATGPGSKEISTNEELKRVIPVLKELKKQLNIPISIDTFNSEVAKEALKNGADIINDITALRGDKKMAKLIAAHNCPLIMMYSKDKSARTTAENHQYKNITKSIVEFLKERIAFAKSQGIKADQIIIDPGMGHYLSSNPSYSYEVLLKLQELQKLNQPILVGLSRKSFLGGELPKRDQLGQAPSAIAYLNGARIIRTHDVKGLKAFFQQVGIT